MKECSKSISRRLSNPDFINHYFVGDGLDIGGKPDPLSLYCEIFCQMKSVRTWDWEDGDAQFLEGVSDEQFDFIHSSHCLEHMKDPEIAINNWFRVVKPGGHMIITVPDEDLYEQGEFPSSFNHDHKWTFTIFKEKSWSPKSINVLTLVQKISGEFEVLRIQQLSATYRYKLPRFDQTLTPIAESGIELVVRKRLPEEVEDMGRWKRTRNQPERELRLHLNQYCDDLDTLKNSNNSAPPFNNDNNL